MSAPIIWIGAPALMGLVFWFFRARHGKIALWSTLFCILMAVLAWVVPFDRPVRIGGLSFVLNTTFTFAGRSLILDAGDRVFLVFIYLLCAFWFVGGYASRATRLLVPLGLGVVSLLIAALAVEPFLYAALLVETAVLMSVPILAPPESKIGQGVLRFLIFQTLAMPFILLAGWALEGVEQNPSNAILVMLSIAFLGLGFAFWLAVFPFYTWIPMLAEQSDPYVAGFIFIIFPTVDLLLGLNYLERFGWLRASQGLFEVIGQLGTLMVITAGIWAAFQKDLARLLGYAVIVETGFSLIAVSLSPETGTQLFSSMFLPRLIGFGLWSLSLSIIVREAGSTRFEVVNGLAQRLPYATAGFALASLTLGGLPLLPVFPIHQVILEELARQSLMNAVWVLIGGVGMLFSSFRALAVLSRGMILSQTSLETRLQIVLILGGIAGLLLIGFLPQVFLPLFHGLAGQMLVAP